MDAVHSAQATAVSLGLLESLVRADNVAISTQPADRRLEEATGQEASLTHTAEIDPSAGRQPPLWWTGLSQSCQRVREVSSDILERAWDELLPAGRSPAPPDRRGNGSAGQQEQQQRDHYPPSRTLARGGLRRRVSHGFELSSRPVLGAGYINIHQNRHLRYRYM